MNLVRRARPQSVAQAPVESQPAGAEAYAAADDNHRKLITELADVDRSLAAIAEQRRAAGPSQAGEALVVGLPAKPPGPEIPDPAPLIARRRELESAIRLQADVLRDLRGAKARELSIANAPQARQKLTHALRAIESAIDAVRDYKNFIARLDAEFGVTGPIPLVGIEPEVFGPEGSAMSLLIARMKAALGI